MQRIQDPDALVARPAIPTLTGSVGFFTNGNPQTAVPATPVPDWFLNMLQEESCALLTAAGLPLDGSATVLQAVEILIAKAPRFTNEQGFNASGTFTMPAGTYFIRVRLYAGGGGGGYGNSAGGGGGGGGGYAEGIFAVTPGETLTITVGSGGAGGVNGTGAATGGATAILTGGTTLCSATGGGGAGQGTSGGLGVGGTPGSGSSGALDAFGSVGGAGSANSAVIIGGQGGGTAGYSGGPFIMLAFGNKRSGQQRADRVRRRWWHRDRKRRERRGRSRRAGVVK